MKKSIEESKMLIELFLTILLNVLEIEVIDLLVYISHINFRHLIETALISVSITQLLEKMLKEYHVVSSSCNQDRSFLLKNRKSIKRKYHDTFAPLPREIRGRYSSNYYCRKDVMNVKRKNGGRLS